MTQLSLLKYILLVVFLLIPHGFSTLQKECKYGENCSLPFENSFGCSLKLDSQNEIMLNDYSNVPIWKASTVLDSKESDLYVSVTKDGIVEITGKNGHNIWENNLIKKSNNPQNKLTFSESCHLVVQDSFGIEIWRS